MKWVKSNIAPWLEVSETGLLRRVEKGGSFRETDLKGHLEATGYLSIGTFNGPGQRVRSTIHVLVCSAFHGPRPTPKHHAAHKNGIKTDNRADNLYWATPSQNAHDKVNAGVQVGESHPNAKLSSSDVARIVALKAQGLTGKEIGRIFGVNRNTINRICAGKARHQCLAKMACGQDNPRIAAAVTPLFAGGQNERS